MQDLHQTTSWVILILVIYMVCSVRIGQMCFLDILVLERF